MEVNGCCMTVNPLTTGVGWIEWFLPWTFFLWCCRLKRSKSFFHRHHRRRTSLCEDHERNECSKEDPEHLFLLLALPPPPPCFSSVVLLFLAPPAPHDTIYKANQISWKDCYTIQVTYAYIGPRNTATIKKNKSTLVSRQVCFVEINGRSPNGLSNRQLTSTDCIHEGEIRDYSPEIINIHLFMEVTKAHTIN